MKKKIISLFVATLLLLLLLASCSSNRFNEIDVFNKQKMSSIDVDSLIELFNKQYINPVQTGNIMTWDIPQDSSGKGVKIRGYSIEKALIQIDDGKIGRVAFITPTYDWREGNTTTDALAIINECIYFINLTTNNLPITDAVFSASDDINSAREFIDRFLNTVKAIEEDEMKSNKSKGKAFIDGKEWDNPFVMGRLLSVDYSIIDLDRRYNECQKRLMVMEALEKEKSTLIYCWDSCYMSLNLYPSTLTIEFGYNPNLTVDITSEGMDR